MAKFLEAIVEFVAKGVGDVEAATEKIKSKVANTTAGIDPTAKMSGDFQKLSQTAESLLGKSAGKIVGSFGEASKAIGGGFGAAAEGAAGAIEGIGGAVTSLLGPIGGAVAAGMAAFKISEMILSTAKEIVVASFQWATHMERVKATLGAIAGIQGARTIINASKQFVGTDIDTGAAQAAGRKLMQGMSSRDAAEKVQQLGAVALLTGNSIEQMAESYERVKIRGQVTMRTLMGMGTQLNDEIMRLHPNLVGVGSSLEQAAEKGKVSVNMLDEAIASLASRGERVMRAQQQTTSGMFTNIGAKWSQIFGEWAEHFLQVFKPIIEYFSSWADACAAVWHALLTLLEPLYKIEAFILRSLLTPFRLFADAITEYFTAIADELQPFTDIFDAWVDLWDSITNDGVSFKDIIHELLAPARWLAEILKDWSQHIVAAIHNMQTLLSYLHLAKAPTVADEESHGTAASGLLQSGTGGFVSITGLAEKMQAEALQNSAMQQTANNTKQTADNTSAIVEALKNVAKSAVAAGAESAAAMMFGPVGGLVFHAMQ